ncbi:MAG: hypothetical protein GY807_10425 [Gammaproteobacteria bacterium]|nr:hypothetical protein [Gammaproteobacteria bacterium]
MFKQAHVQVANAGRNRWSIAFTDTACVVTKHGIQSPAQGDSRPLMATHCVGKGLCLRWDRVDEVMLLDAPRIALQAFALHHTDAA